MHGHGQDKLASAGTALASQRLAQGKPASTGALRPWSSAIVIQGLTAAASSAMSADRVTISTVRASLFEQPLSQGGQRWARHGTDTSPTREQSWARQGTDSSFTGHVQSCHSHKRMKCLHKWSLHPRYQRRITDSAFALFSRWPASP